MSALPSIIAPAPVPVVVGFSGGLDSSALLHMLASLPEQRRLGLRAIHIHHGLQGDADNWAAHCAAVCQALAIPLTTIKVCVDLSRGEGLEAAARAARHAAFISALQPGEWLALAHHLDDQAETFLLRALRGSGVDGMAAMRNLRDYAPGKLWRPLLATPRDALLAYATQHQLEWIEDPSNASDVHDRNFLRQHVLPMLHQRWPHATEAFARSAALAAESDTLLKELDAAALALCVRATDQLCLAALSQLLPAQRARVLRAWVQNAGAPPLPGNGVKAIEREVSACPDDRQAGFRWQQWQIRRWRQRLYLLPLTTPQPDWQLPWDGKAPLRLPDGSQIQLRGAHGFEQPLQVRSRRGGERMQLTGRPHTHALKDLLQTASIPPWERTQVPLLFDGDQLLAAGDILLSARLRDWLQQHNAQLQWLREAQ
jgi:tRNA(Ile)-lysidine synthase